MSYNHFRYARRVDADTTKILNNAGDTLLWVKEDSNWTYLKGDNVAGRNMRLSGGNDYPFIDLSNSGDLVLRMSTGDTMRIYNEATEVIRILNSGAIHIAECSKPTAVANFGCIWTENDNTLHFNDGAGTEYTIDITPV